MSTTGLRRALQRLIDAEPLTELDMTTAMGEILAGQAPPAQVAALAMGLRMRGETTVELTAAARALREHARPVAIEAETLVDTCGTGGDGAHTFNISTTSAIVVAACGLPVAKHGNRAISSRSGSADVLSALGVRTELTPHEAQACLSELGLAFFFAPAFHGALRHAAGVRRELAIRTFFNLLGPLANPASATHQLVGVFDPGRVRQMAEVLGDLGVKGAWVVHGAGGLDEISTAGPTQVAALSAGRVRVFQVAPEDFGCPRAPLSELAGGDAETNASMTRDVLAGRPGGPRWATVLNAAGALLAAGAEDEPRRAAERAIEAIDSGRAKDKLEAWAAWTPR